MLIYIIINSYNTFIRENYHNLEEFSDISKVTQQMDQVCETISVGLWSPFFKYEQFRDMK